MPALDVFESYAMAMPTSQGLLLLSIALSERLPSFSIHGILINESEVAME